MEEPIIPDDTLEKLETHPASVTGAIIPVVVGKLPS